MIQELKKKIVLSLSSNKYLYIYMCRNKELQITIYNTIILVRENLREPSRFRENLSPET